MHGPVPAHPPHRPPAQGTIILLRVLFVAGTVLSLGFLAWAALLRAAIVQRKPLGWWLFAGDLALVIGTSLWSEGYPETDWRTDVAVAVLLLQLAGTVAYYLFVDIGAVRAAGQPNGPLPAPVPGPGFGPAYGSAPASGPGAAPHSYGPPQPPARLPLYAQETHPSGPQDPTPYGSPEPNPYAVTETRLPPQPAPGQPAPAPYRPTPPQERPQPQRIDRVRAELDELSDYLRKEEGR
ncbi:hypothetical protein ACGFWI_25400 [Streptomyces sp. NPDC048434]|uniref:hypothetical protein n=1 Tax=Streptomyces sp. NPDC048434 TaxID=3365549 RepID=UPI0037136146